MSKWAFIKSHWSELVELPRQNVDVSLLRFDKLRN